MWDAVRDRLVESGRQVLTDLNVVEIRHDGTRVHTVLAERDDHHLALPTAHVVSSMPLRELIERLAPAAPIDVLRAARALRYRDFITVALIVNRPDVFFDQWIYVHDPNVRVGRIQNYGNWSEALLANRQHSCLGFEYFCADCDDLWGMSDCELIELAKLEAVKLGLVNEDEILDGTVCRAEKAYPVYDEGYAENVGRLRTYLSRFANIHPVGRNGLHKYNNQDHSMFTAMLAVRNILGERHDVWSVNADCEYHEVLETRPPVRYSGGGHVPEPPIPLVAPYPAFAARRPGRNQRRSPAR
jgi:protoporphyrinogen oxidase